MSAVDLFLHISSTENIESKFPLSIFLLALSAGIFHIYISGEGRKVSALRKKRLERENAAPKPTNETD